MSSMSRPSASGRDATATRHEQGSILGNRCADWLRAERGRARWKWSDHSYERERPVALSFDAPAGADGRTLADVVADRRGDPEADRGPAFGGWSKDEIAKKCGIALSSVSLLEERLANELLELAASRLTLKGGKQRRSFSSPRP